MYKLCRTEAPRIPALSLLMSFACILEPWIYPAQQKPQLCQPTQTLLPRSHPKPFLQNGVEPTQRPHSQCYVQWLSVHTSLPWKRIMFKFVGQLHVMPGVLTVLPSTCFQVIWSSLDTTKGGVCESRHCMTETSNNYIVTYVQYNWMINDP